MKTKVINYFNKDYSRWQFWLLWAFAFKLAFFIFKILTRTHSVEGIDGFWGFTDADTAGYLSPIENFIKNGNYAPDYRMPGYGVLYLPFALIFSKAIACNLLIIIQLVLSSLSVYVLALIAKSIFSTPKYFYYTFFLYSISCYTCSYDTWLMTESLTASLLIFSGWYFVKYYETNKSYNVFSSGLLLTWAVFCRPVMFPLLLFFMLFLIIRQFSPKPLKGHESHLQESSHNNAQSPFRGLRQAQILAFLLPFIICDSLWTCHNYREHNSFAPFTNTLYDPNIKDSFVVPLIKYGQAWGAPYIYEPNNVLGMAANNGGRTQLFVNLKAIPEYSYTSKFNRDSLLKLTQLMDTLQKANSHQLIANSQKDAINKKVNDYVASLKSEKPFVYYVKAPLILLRRFLLNSGSPVLFDKPVTHHDIIPFCVKIFFAALYYIILACGALGIILLRKKLFRFRSLEFLITGIALYLIIIHPLILRFCLTRYLAPAYPFILVCAVVGICGICERVFGGRY